MKRILRFFTSLMVVMFMGSTLSVFAGIAPMIGIGVLAFGSLIPQIPTGALGVGIEVELWHTDIAEEIFKDNEFMKYAFDADSYVLQGAVVHHPQSGGPANVEKNRSVYPAVSVKRTDTDATYALDEYTTDPVLIQNAEVVEVSYDKRRSVINENMEGIKEYIADDMLVKWSSNVQSAMIVKTTGDAIVATAPGSTGNRKSFTETDLKACRDKLNKQNVSKQNRFIMLSTEMLSELETSMGDKFHYKDVVNLPEGTITKLYGFNIIERSEVLIADNADAIKAVGAAAAITDSQAGLFWQKNMVERALGEIKMFESIDDPSNYGDTYSFLVRAGGRGRRSDGKGVGVVIQTTV